MSATFILFGLAGLIICVHILRKDYLRATNLTSKRATHESQTKES